MGILAWKKDVTGSQGSSVGCAQERKLVLGVAASVEEAHLDGQNDSDRKNSEEHLYG